MTYTVSGGTLNPTQPTGNPRKSGPLFLDFVYIERHFWCNICPLTQALGKRIVTACAAIGQIPRSTERILV